MIYVPIEQTGVKFKPSRYFVVFRNAPIVVFVENGRFCCRERLFLFTKTNGLNLLGGDRSIVRRFITPKVH
jgi:hypothetical protein